MGGESASDGVSERAITPIVGVALLIGVVLAGAGAIVLSAGPVLEDAEGEVDAETAEQELAAVDESISSAIHGGKASTRIYLGSKTSGAYERTDGANVSVTVSNGFGSSCTANYSLETLQYEDREGRTIGYEAGGIWRRDETGSALVSAPDVRYYAETIDGETAPRLDFRVTDLDGAVGTGTLTASPRLGDGSHFDCLGEAEFGLVQGVEFTVSDTRFHEAWYEFLREEFDAVPPAEAGSDDNVVVYDEATGEVTVSAALDYDRPFVDYVDVEQTIYGGVYVDGRRESHHGEVTVDGYDGHEHAYDAEENVSPDLYVAGTDELRLQPMSVIDGYAVSNGDLRAQPDSNVSEYVFYAGTERFNADGNEVTAFNVSEQFDEVRSIDDDVDLARSFLQGLSDVPASGRIDAGLYHEAGDRSLSSRVIDTADGDVHVAVDGSLELTDITVTGPNRAYFYVSEDITVSGDVTVPEDRAEHLWVYGSSSADVAVASSTTFHGVLYAPGSNRLRIDNGAEIYGAVVGGKGDIGDDVAVHFDRSLRTDVPIPPQDRTQRYAGERKPLDVSFVLDRSGSMEDNDPEKRRVDATRGFIDKLDEERDDMASVFDFNDTGEMLHPMSENLTSVNESVVGYEEGNTNISLGMKLALDEHEAVDDPTQQPIIPGRDQERVMILLSDGKNSPGNGTDGAADNATIEQAERAADMNVTVYTVGLGFDDLDEALLEEIANTTGGENVNVNDSERLEEVFAGIAEDVTETVQVEFEAYPHETKTADNEHVIDVVAWEVELESE